MSAADAGKWITCARPRPAARVRLFCVPYAGGGTGAFRTWADRLPDFVEVLGIQPPGRESRLLENVDYIFNRVFGDGESDA